MNDASSPPNSDYGFPTPGPQTPTGQEVMNQVFFLSDFEWNEVREKKTFDYILPGVRPLFLQTRVKSRYYAGLYDLGDHYLNINRGIGTSIVPLRVFSPQEITSLTFHSIP
ncbi:MAG: hypothetical protein ABSH28_05740 [Acidobacteriota bacterium]|jgi:hypothetical protein